MQNRIVITGSPGVGKTTLLLELKSRGFKCYDEPARKILTEQLEINGPALPSKDPKQFILALLEDVRKNYLESKNTDETTFFDRAFGDLYMYCNCFGVAPSILDDYKKEFSYRNDVFILPIWKEIFVNDNLRKMPFEESFTRQTELTKAYENLGYSLIEIPKVTVEERADFVLQQVIS